MTNKNGFTLVELTIVMLLGSIFIFGLTQYWITGWKLIDRERSVLALCAEARAIRNIILNGGGPSANQIAGLREQRRSFVLAVGFGYDEEQNTPFGAGFDRIDVNGQRFQVGQVNADGAGPINIHVLQYCDGGDPCNDTTENFRTLYSRYVDGDGRHGYIRGIDVARGDCGGTVYCNATLNIDLDDFQARVITFQDGLLTDTSNNYFKQTFRFFTYAHAQ